ncbi:MAG: FKBP-type peptidyl-prolyl cis-trans isomerase [Lentisphaeria bacterium]|nr:FKBP-type peptidyl-prolyl cis-trans isomerase [Lentisphaeria bacterium]NQZ70723.1 FKBP-type peptidyl-prolyl cis-trans isomerase [Lentisphaeria bacterium]
MKTLFFILSLCCLVAQDKPAPAKKAPALKEAPQKAAEVDSFIKKYSYAIGNNTAKSLKRDGLELDSDAFIKGMIDGQAGKSKFTDAQIRAIFKQIDTMLRKKYAKKMAADKKQALIAGELAKKEGPPFHAKKKAEKGVITLPSGLQYKILKSGKGEAPKRTDKVKCHYEGKLLNGTVFDSSYKRSGPTEFPVSNVIPGWTEALLLMKVGDKWELYIPQKLAYGPRGAGAKIPPFSSLIFTMELMEISKMKLNLEGSQK